MKEEELVTGRAYKGRTGNTFVLVRTYSPNTKCFRRQDGVRHYGREFIEYENGKRVIDLQELNNKGE